MSQTIDTPSYTIELSDGSIRPMTVKELAIRLEQLMSADKGIAQPLDESGEVSDPLVFINLIDSGGSWKGTYSELASLFKQGGRSWVPVYQNRRKTPCFNYGDIRR